MRTIGQRLSVDWRQRLTPPKVEKLTAAHYLTPEHAAWRKDVIAASGGACQGCGRRGTRLFADHVVELKDGGAPLDRANGQAMCGSCHTRKTAQAKAARHATSGV